MRINKLFLVFGAFCLVFFGFTMSRNPTVAAPTFTGDAAADFTGPNVIVLTDRAIDGINTPDVGLPRPYTDTDVSGFDIQALYMEYDPATDIMYVGIDCFVICGDADGDGDPDAPGDILGRPVADGGLGGEDVARFGAGESFGLLIDTDNDFDFDAGTGDFDVVIGVNEAADLDAIGVFSYTDDIGFQLLGDTWGDPLANTVTLFADPSADTPDLEFTIADFSTLPGFTPGAELGAYQLHLGMGSSVDDGIGEDFSPEQSSPVVITPTPTPTEVPPTPTPTDVPPSPTPTLPPPTEVPPTGANLLARLSDTTHDPIRAANPNREAGIVHNGDFMLEIPAIALDTAVTDRGWQTVLQANGTVANEWEEVEFAAGWHKNSAAPGQRGNVVISGHSNTGGAVFHDLWRLRAGQSIYVNHNGVRYTYAIESIDVEPETYATEAQRNKNAAYIQQTDDNRLTLVTCWPWYSDSHRVFVVAKMKSIAMIVDDRQ